MFESEWFVPFYTVTRNIEQSVRGGIPTSADVIMDSLFKHTDWILIEIFDTNPIGSSFELKKTFELMKIIDFFLWNLCWNHRFIKNCRKCCLSDIFSFALRFVQFDVNFLSLLRRFEKWIDVSWAVLRQRHFLTSSSFWLWTFHFLTLDGFLTRTNKRQDFDYFFLNMQLLEQAQTLLNFDGQTPFDVNILDAVINTMYRGQGDAVRQTNMFFVFIEQSFSLFLLII